MERTRNSVGFVVHKTTTQRLNSPSRPRVCGRNRAEDHPQPHTPFPDSRILKTIAVYLHHSFDNIRFRITDLDSTPEVYCEIEIVYPRKFQGIRVGIPWSVVRGVV